MSQTRVIAIAVAATASTSLVLAGIIFYFVHRCSMARQRGRNKQHHSSFRMDSIAMVQGPEEFVQHDGRLRGLLVEENGRDVLYLRRGDGGGRFTNYFSKVWFNPMTEEEKEMDDRGLKPSISSPMQEIPLIPNADCAIKFSEEEMAMENSGPSNIAPAPPPIRIQSKQAPLPPPPPPLPPPPPPPPLAQNKSKPPPPPQPPPLLQGKTPSKQLVSQLPSKTKPGSSSSPLPPMRGGLFSSLKPPVPPIRGKLPTVDRVETPELYNAKDKRENQMKLKPLHWDKVPINAEYSMVWHEILDGSFLVDDNLMEALFGYNAENLKKPEARKTSRISITSGSAQIFLLDPRKSQNIAIVLKSLAISRTEILDALQEGHGLNTDTLEKLIKISPTPEEAEKILQFDGNPTKLADAESFLYHILKAVPSAFIRINAMLFRSSYDPDILHLKESLQTLELGCKDLRNRGIFFKLLEAILKAGNRMNAGTARGDAQGFNLSALRKLSSVKSTDGKTTLLHFVVQQVIQSEGKRRADSQNPKFGSNHIGGSNMYDQELDMKTTKEEDGKECIMLGLPIVGGLSTEFSNVKKSATVDYDTFINMRPTLTMRVSDIRQLVSQCGSSERSGFVREMKGFLEECEDELKVVREEQTRVLQIVKRTTEYYQAGAAKEKGTDPLHLFGIVKEFLGMVDQVCVDISKKLQKKSVTSAGSSPPLSPLPMSPKTRVKFQNLQSYFDTDRQRTISSESEDDF